MDKFEEYKLFVEDSARFTERRQAISNTYVTVNSLLLAAIGLLIKDLGARGIWTLLLLLPLVVAGVLFPCGGASLSTSTKRWWACASNVARDRRTARDG